MEKVSAENSTGAIPSVRQDDSSAAAAFLSNASVMTPHSQLFIAFPTSARLGSAASQRQLGLGGTGVMNPDEHADGAAYYPGDRDILLPGDFGQGGVIPGLQTYGKACRFSGSARARHICDVTYTTLQQQLQFSNSKGDPELALAGVLGVPAEDIRAREGAGSEPMASTVPTPPSQ
jgi:hypothetical protein